MRNNKKWIFLLNIKLPGSLLIRGGAFFVAGSRMFAPDIIVPVALFLTVPVIVMVFWATNAGAKTARNRMI